MSHWGPDDDDDLVDLPREKDGRASHVHDPSRPNETIDALLAAVSLHPKVLCRSNELVRVVASFRHDDAVDSPFFRPLTAANLRDFAGEHFCAVAIREKNGERYEVPIKIPDEVVTGALERERYDDVFRAADILIESPILRDDGTIFGEPGYDASTRAIFVSRAKFESPPSEPTRDDAVLALDRIRDYFRDYPFVDASHESALIAAIMTHPVRHLISGCVPGTMIEATTPGSGKGKLLDIISLIYAGRTGSKAPYSEDAEEMRKSYASMLSDGKPFIMIDNVKGKFGDPTLDALLTTEYYDDRILGTSKRLRVRITAQMFATGNNPFYVGDIARRLLVVRLESKHENPEKRDDFKYMNLLQTVRERRKEIHRDILTIHRAYHLAGKPSQGAKPWGSFEGWSSYFCNLMLWFGMPNPMDARSVLQNAADPVRAALSTIMQGFEKMDPRGNGMTISQLVKTLFDERAINAPPEPDYYESMREAILELAPPKKFKAAVDNQRLGTFITNARGRVIGGLRLVDAGVDHGAKKWKVENTAKPEPPVVTAPVHLPDDMDVPF